MGNLKFSLAKGEIKSCLLEGTSPDVFTLYIIVRGDRDSRANLMPIYGDLYQIKL